MKAPVSWLKEYVDIKLPLTELMWRMTEIGLTTESFEKIHDDTILDAEVTPNRPDWMSMIGISREIAAIQNTPLILPKIHPLPEKTANLPIKIENDFTLCPRYSAITIKGVLQSPSPKWLQDRLIAVNLRPINNLVDITNYVMFETGNPIHVFDYDKLDKGKMKILKSIGGEEFVSVDGKKYHLPKNAIIFKSGNEVVDLCGIKGGLNSGISKDTKNILILVAVYNGKLIRRTSQYLSLWSEASRIFERGANIGGTIDTLKRTVNLILKTTRGQIASDISDVKKDGFTPWKVNLSIQRLERILGIKIDDNKTLNLLKRLNLSPLLKNAFIECTIPTYRADIQIEEDLIEEVARLYGYNNFPKTLPIGEIPVKKIPYFKDYNLDHKIKNLLTSAGYSEIQTYSLISEKDLDAINISSEKVLRIDNPVSLEFEYLRPTLKLNLLKALSENKPSFEQISLFEIGKVYSGKTIDSAKEEYHIAGITNEKTYYEVKGVLERIFSDFLLTEEPTKYIEDLNGKIYFSFPYSILKKINTFRQFTPLPKYPAIIEDMAFIINDEVKIGDIIKLIKLQSMLIKDVNLLDKYQHTRTFRINYQHIERNLTNDDIAPVREKIIKILKTKQVLPK